MSSSGRISSQYAAAANVPLIKAPTLWLPRPVEMPIDIHPLPDDISAYFVYPFTLEPHILAQVPPIHERIAAQRKEEEKVLSDRIEKGRREKAEQMNRIAPGWNPSSFLTPNHLLPLNSTQTSLNPSSSLIDAQNDEQAGQKKEEEDEMAAFHSLKIT